MYRYLATITLGIFLFIGSFGFLVASDHFGHGKDCPLMLGVVCLMSPIEHISSVQKSFASILPAIVMLLTVLFVRSSSVRFALATSRSRSQLSRSDIPPPSILQELYSQGILNPKVH